jgi:MMPL family
VTNVVSLIGIAIDYSMLVVFRYREELRAQQRSGRRAADYHGHGRSSDDLLRVHGRGRAGAARVPAGAVHSLDGDRPAAGPGGEHRGVGQPAAGAARPTTGRFVGLQEFGIGLSAVILLDATVVRALLVPATMNLLGRWNWYLPERVRRAMRLRRVGAPHVGVAEQLSAAPGPGSGSS